MIWMKMNEEKFECAKKLFRNLASPSDLYTIDPKS